MARNDDKKNVRCSFCGKPQTLVDRLIAGNGSYICDECIRLCMNILDEDFMPDAKNKKIDLKASDVPKPAEIRAKLGNNRLLNSRWIRILPIRDSSVR